MQAFENPNNYHRREVAAQLVDAARQKVESVDQTAADRYDHLARRRPLCGDPVLLVAQGYR